jgi:Ca-activated chloride channel homolog
MIFKIGYAGLLSKIFLISALFFIPVNTTFSQPKHKKEAPPTRILFLFDASQSMYGRWQTGMKIDVAKSLLSELLDSLKTNDNAELALRVYGHLKKFPPQDCDDTRLEVPFGKKNHSLIKKVLSEVNPKGTTPIARALEECAKDFPDSPGRNIIILITDGLEECGGDPCAVSAALQKKGVFLRPFVIGMGVDETMIANFECIGNYYDATNETVFRNVLNIVISQVLNTTSAQVNLLDSYSRPNETNVVITFYDNHTGAIKRNTMHTLNSRGNPDTLSLDPLITYDVVAHTIPSVRRNNVKLTPGIHTIIPLDAPQGFLNLKFDQLSDYRTLPCIVRKANDMITLNIQEFNNTEKYITGKYDLEVLSIPRIHIKDVDIAQSHTTTVQIPKPGIVTLISNTSGYGSIFVEENNVLSEVYHLNENLTKESVVIQPGNYRVVYRPKASKESSYTVEKSFKIVSGSSIIVNIN